MTVKTMLILVFILILLLTGPFLFDMLIDIYYDIQDKIYDKKFYRKWVFFNKDSTKTYPPHSGWYLCTVESKVRIPMLLYWDDDKYNFIDPVRKSVFDTYLVMTTEKINEFIDTEAIMPDDERFKRIYTDDLVDRTDSVVAWKSEPKVFTKKVKNEKIHEINRII